MNLWRKLKWNWRAIGHMCYAVPSIRVWWIVDEMVIASTSKFINSSENSGNICCPSSRQQLRSAAHTHTPISSITGSGFRCLLSSIKMNRLLGAAVRRDGRRDSPEMRNAYNDQPITRISNSINKLFNLFVCGIRLISRMPSKWSRCTHAQSGRLPSWQQHRWINK